jgi:hypothetical protein
MSMRQEVSRNPTCRLWVVVLFFRFRGFQEPAKTDLSIGG